MSGWFLDASVLLASEAPEDDNHRSARILLTGSDALATLDLAFYEVANVAIRAWRDPLAAGRLCERVTALADDGGVVRADPELIAAAAALAAEHGISVYDAAYVVGARITASELVSCDLRDLVKRGLARLPRDAEAPKSTC